MIGFKVPKGVFHTRVEDASVSDGSKRFEWKQITTDDCFSGKKVVLFALPGAFTPTCSNYQLPGFEKIYDELRDEGIDEVYCLAVNDSFVMNAWGKSLGIKKVKLLADGSNEFTRKMGMLVSKDNVGFGLRSWRYAAIVDDGIIQQWFSEEGLSDNCSTDSYGTSSPENVLKNIRTSKK
ncbi:MAG: peroxiredoxin [Candidatus Liberibacter ctenarytainae]|uniref:Glutathione-dependent peroxiredoxin n=1 Tax=Candidatus Liberibacter ctenarytainae TaxID=2020335 RepID=A0A937AJA8_9HYPH|nr:peroxiredoxin [Candidatus Liberibacter ctenarytainae]